MTKLSFRAVGSLALPVLFLAGCETRSISDSGYRGRFVWESGNRYYRGELSEMDVLGTSLSQKVTETEIRNALGEGGSVRVPNRGVRPKDAPSRGIRLGRFWN